MALMHSYMVGFVIYVIVVLNKERSEVVEFKH